MENQKQKKSFNIHLKRIRKPYLSLATKNGKKVKKVKKIVFKKKK